MHIEQITPSVLNKQFGNWELILKKLGSISIFEGILEEHINTILMQGEIITLQSNEYLIRQNETDDNIYILLQGYLIITRKQDQQESYVAEISPIDVIGEASMFTKNPRNANVISIRDSILIRLSRDNIFSNNKFDSLITNLARTNEKRLVGKRSLLSLYKRKVKIITLVSVSDFKEIRQFAEKFHLSLSEYGATSLEYFDEGNLPISKDHFLKELSEKEYKYDYLINVLGSKLSDVTMLCINQTDHLVFVANEDCGNQLNALEQYILKEKKYIHRKELAFLRQPGTTITTELQKFMEMRALDGYYSIIDEKCDFSRLARCIVGKNTCLVLSGGGARGLAHIGTIKALQEKKIIVDMVGGTSMGSLIAAAYARSMNYETMLELMKQFCFNYKFNKYTIPFISIFTGKDFTNGFKKICGENTYIENLRCRYFCVACNLSRMELKVFNTGLLWSAVRASFSIPAILPPVINEEGEILVDGCVMNNLPVDQMELVSNGGKILASQIVQTSTIHKFDSSDGISHGARLLLNKINPFSKKTNLPNINFIFMKSLLISSQFHQFQMANNADFCINHDIKKVGLFEFKSLEKIIEAGYQNTMNQLDDGSFGA